jgi:hypothetical protein
MLGDVALEALSAILTLIAHDEVKCQGDMRHPLLISFPHVTISFSTGTQEVRLSIVSSSYCISSYSYSL